MLVWKEIQSDVKALVLQKTTVRAIISKWTKLGTIVSLPRHGWPAKILPRDQEGLQASHTIDKVSAYDFTTRKRLGKSGIHQRVACEKHC